MDLQKHRILDVLPDRTQSHLVDYDYWRSMPRNERLKVKFFVCNMWLPYTELARTFFPHAKIIVDKYHFIRQVTWAIENVCKRFQRSMPASLRKYYKRTWKLILIRYKKLKDENKKACDLILQYSDDLRLAYMMKNGFTTFARWNPTANSNRNSMTGLLMPGIVVSQNSRNASKPSSPGEKKS